jgi:hypothetical protein
MLYLFHICSHFFTCFHIFSHFSPYCQIVAILVAPFPTPRSPISPPPCSATAPRHRAVRYLHLWGEKRRQRLEDQTIRTESVQCTLW